MHKDNLKQWTHDHVFDQHIVGAGEYKTIIVIILTGIMMTIEVVAGIVFGSMALLADGLHMASHAVALSITAFAYIYARRHARSDRFTFGTGKVNALGGYSGAVLLALFAVLMVWESGLRLLKPIEIDYNQAIGVAILGLLVNGICAFILGFNKNEHGDDHHHHDHNDEHHHDLNLRSAYLHVIADAVTSILAIVALIAAKYQGLVWMDAAMGVVGAILVARWSTGLLRSTSSILLDSQGPAHISQQIRDSIEIDGDSKITDLHLWTIAPKRYSVVMTVVAHNPLTPEEYKMRIPDTLGAEHIAIEIHNCAH